MASTAAPYGLRPVNILGGSPNSGALRLYPILSGYNTGMFYGDAVLLGTNGTIQKFTGTTTASPPPVGVFMGCEYMSATQGLLNRNQWTAGTSVPSGTTAWAYVVEDPDMLFEIQASGSLALNSVGANAAIVQGSGSTATGISGVALNSSGLANTATLPLRIVDFVRRPGSAVGDAYTDVIVRFNLHFNRSTTGNTPA